MKNAVIVFLMLTAVAVTTTYPASETTVNGKLFTHWVLDNSDSADGENSFGLGRAYLTVKSKISDEASVRITTDMRRVSNYDGYSIILKYGYFDWKPKFGNGNLKIRLGLQPTLYFNQMNKMWGRRYLLKTAGDLNKFLTTSDLGSSFIYSIGEKGKRGTVALQILNGTSYTEVEELNNQKDFSGFILLMPFVNNQSLEKSKFLIQYYSGTQNVADSLFFDAAEFKKQLLSVGALLAYKNIIDIGGDFNFATTGPGNAIDADIKGSTISFFGTLYFSGFSDESSALADFNIFGRIDMFDPNTDIDNDSKNLFIGGLEYSSDKGFVASLNIKTTSFQNSSLGSESFFGINTLLKF